MCLESPLEWRKPGPEAGCFPGNFVKRLLLLAAGWMGWGAVKRGEGKGLPFRHNAPGQSGKKKEAGRRVQ